MKLRLSVRIPDGVLAAYIDPDTRESVPVKRLYFDRPTEVDDYHALHLIAQNKKLILPEDKWQAEFGKKDKKLNPQMVDKKQAVEHILSLGPGGVKGLYSAPEIRDFAKSVFGVKIPGTVKRKEDVAAALHDIAIATKDELETAKSEEAE